MIVHDKNSKIIVQENSKECKQVLCDFKEIYQGLKEKINLHVRIKMRANVFHSTVYCRLWIF